MKEISRVYSDFSFQNKFYSFNYAFTSDKSGLEWQNQLPWSQIFYFCLFRTPWSSVLKANMNGREIIFGKDFLNQVKY